MFQLVLEMIKEIKNRCYLDCYYKNIRYRWLLELQHVIVPSDVHTIQNLANYYKDTQIEYNLRNVLNTLNKINNKVRRQIT